MSTIIGYSIDTDGMKNSTCGKIGIATKGGTKYFCKVFNTPVEPASNGALSPAAMAKNAAEFEEFRNRKKRVNKTLREIAGPGGNIVYPMEETVYDHHWTEFSEFVEGALEEDRYAEVINSLPEDKKLLVLKIAMGALQTIHNQKIVHGDLKLTNIMLVKNGMNNYVSKIIDFDGAFFENDVPINTITGTPDYYSPELAIYCNNEDPEFREGHRNWITTRSDIFTMGLILHEYLTGEKPKPDHLTKSLQRMKDSGKKFIYPWQVILTRDKGEERPRLVLSSRIKNPVYIALISDMLVEDFTQRPSASEILLRLNSNALPIETDPWSEDKIEIDGATAAKHVVALRKHTIKIKGKPEIHAYEVVEKDGRRFLKTAEELVADGCAQKDDKPGFDDPWPEDKIAWVPEKLTEYYSVRRGAKKGVYEATRKDKKKYSVNASILKSFGMAKGIDGAGAKKDPPAPASGKTYNTGDELWPEEKDYMINRELEKNGYVFQGKTEMNGTKGYRFLVRGAERFILPSTCKLMKILVPKK